VRPTIERSAPKCADQKRCDSTADALRPGSASSGRIVRPTTAGTPHACTGQRQLLSAPVRGDVIEHRGLRANVEVVGDRETLAAIAAFVIGAVDRDEPLGVGERKRPQDEEVREPEHDAVGGHRQGERENDDECGSAIPPQRPRRIADFTRPITRIEMRDFR
jgi:hypothetical protein